MAIPMTSTRSGTDTRPSWGWAAAALICVMFGVMAMQFNFSLRDGSANWWAQLQARLTSETYSLGPASAHAMYPTYRKTLAAMTSHTALGGLAVSLSVLQFVPALRRRYRIAHRVAGGFVIVAVGTSMIGALTYLSHTPLGEIYASPGFGLALWALALACLGYLVLAVLAIRRRDFRSHMGFMALMMGTLLTAPVLRFEWALFGMATPYNMSEINQGVVASLAVLCNLIMTLWMHHVGAHDLPPRTRESVPGAPLLRVFAYGAAVVIVHEGVLVPLGFDALSAWRTPSEGLPLTALAWALPAAWLALRAPREIDNVLHARPVSTLSSALMALTALGAIAIAMLHADQQVDALGLRFYWAAYGVLSLILLLAAHFSRRSDQPWSLMLLFLALAPVLWPPLWLVAWLCAQPFVVGMWFAATVALAGMSANAFLTAFGVRMPFGSRQRDRQTVAAEVVALS